ncbi:MAG: tRNA (adenosine(37)-N6)-threonylcarbamoyltransferase complex dimerization subunit type 1 TsaB [Clostridia bacterium]|nr:tRNA (adenosine(37)-N6)-threonylcarbamoyltransferase complex dimerization subunit type 1 TsaB [Clostridia bacterium]
MNVLAVDTSTKRACVAVQNSYDIISKDILNEITHSEKLLPLVDEVLTKSNLNLKNIDLYCVTNGPGSFTGIRIGLATIKAMAHVNKKNIFCISSLLLLAYMEYEKRENRNIREMYICPLMDARNNRVYYSLYKISANENGTINIETLLEPSNDYIYDAVKNISKLNVNCIYTGDCLQNFKEYINLDNVDKSQVIYPDASYIIKLYNNLENTNDYIRNYLELDALYARVSQAERESENANK